MKLAAVIIHGIGITKEGYSESFQKAIARAFSAELNSRLKDSIDRTADVIFKEITWDPIVDRNQGRFHDIMMKDEALKPGGGFLERIKQVVLGKLLAFRVNFASKFIADILSYKNQSVYSQIHGFIKTEIDGFLSKFDANVPLTIIAHSLGTVVASDYIYDRQRERGRTGEKNDLWNLFTMGSPLALFSLSCGAEIFNQPIRMDNSNGCWINIFDEDDLIAFKLKILNQEYTNAVLKDLRINTGGLHDSHTAYWRNKDVQKAIAEKLALDWITVNNALEAGKVNELYETYKAEKIASG